MKGLLLVPGLLVSVLWAEDRGPIPSQADVSDVSLELHQTFRAEYAKSRAADRAALARRLLEERLEAAAEPADRYALLRETLDLASKGGDLTVGSTALAHLTADFAVDSREEQLAFYAAIAGQITTLDDARTLVELQIRMVEEAFANDRYDLALRIATQVDTFARRLKDQTHVVRTRALVDRAKMIDRAWASLAVVADLLGNITPDGHRILGCFHCLTKGDWERGLEHLAQGTDEQLKALAVADLAAVEPGAVIAVADAWHEWALSQRGEVRTEALIHATQLYQRCVVGLADPERSRIGKRLEELLKTLGPRYPVDGYPSGAVLLLTFEPPTVETQFIQDVSRLHFKVRNGGARPVVGPFGTAMEFNGIDSRLEIPNAPALQTSGSMTLAMWLKPSQLGVRQNPWNKCYGAEGTLTIEEDGSVNFFHGIAGVNGDPYQGNSMGDVLVPDVWTHLVLVRDLAAKRLVWYRDGQLVNEEDAPYEKPAKSELGISIGYGYTETGFAGLLDEIGLWPRALDAKEVTSLYQVTAIGRR